MYLADRMTARRLGIIWMIFFLVEVSGFSCVLAAGTANDRPSQLKVTFTSAVEPPAVDVTVRPNVWLYVNAGQPPTPFIGHGPFTAQWDGYVSVDLRSEYTFHAEFSGALELVINGTVLLNTNNSGGGALRTKAIRLNKGANAFRAVFTSPQRGDAWLRLEWAPRGGLPVPIPQMALSHDPDLALARGSEHRLARELMGQHRCFKCHTYSGALASDLDRDAPSFENIGFRRNREWMKRWILNPKAVRADAKMPRMFRGPTAEQDAAAVAAFLSSLRLNAPQSSPVQAEAIAGGKDLFETLHCVACHVSPEESEVDSSRITLRAVREKFVPGTLRSFLQKPEADYAWIGMPNFRLTSDEAAELSAYLEAHSAPPREEGEPDAKWIERGRVLVQTSGCLNCHALDLRNEFSAKPFTAVRSRPWTGGCLSEGVPTGLRSPDFDFSKEQIRALLGSRGLDEQMPERFVPAEFAQRAVQELKCGSCHGQKEGFPKIDVLGGKLKPEWVNNFIAGAVLDKPRPWLAARMPAFRAAAKPLAHGMAMLHGYPPETPTEGPVDAELAEIGRRLVSAAGGFSCVACHAVRDVPATQGVESAGINLAYSGERLQRWYYERWVLNPLSIDPATKMPVYFDEQGKSPLTEFFDGDGIRQVRAIWEYLRLGEKMGAPPAQ